MKIQVVSGIDRHNSKLISASSGNRLFPEAYDRSSYSEPIEPCAALLSSDALTHYVSIYVVPVFLKPIPAYAKENVRFQRNRVSITFLTTTPSSSLEFAMAARLG